MAIEGISAAYLKALGFYQSSKNGQVVSNSSLLDFLGGASEEESSGDELFKILSQGFESRVTVNKLLLKDKLAKDLESTYKNALALAPELKGNIVIAIVADSEKNTISVEVLKKEDVLANIKDETERADVKKALDENPIYFVDAADISMKTPDEDAYLKVQKTMSDFILKVKPLIEYLNEDTTQDASVTT